MKRGDLYRVYKGSGRDPKRSRVFVVVSRPGLIAASYPTVVCVPVYSTRHGLSTQVELGIDDGLKHDSAAHCDELMSLPKTALTDFVGSLSSQKLADLRRALLISLSLD